MASITRARRYERLKTLAKERNMFCGRIESSAAVGS
jgi:hypothetical protein